MDLINKENNDIEPLEKVSFKQAGIRERKNLQEWIAKRPQSLGEELLIIQKEFSGFDDTHERLDLLALDKKGNLVVIENKLDDTGRDVVWQSLKYASYCSSLNTKGIKDIFTEHLGKEGSDTNAQQALWPAPGSEDTELGVLMEPEVSHGETEVHPRVQA